MNINLGCGLKPEKGFINHDVEKHSKFIDITFDLNKLPYPYKDNTFSHINAFNVLEHVELPFYKIMNELYRIAKNDCIIDLVLPFYNSTSAHSIDHYTHNFEFSSFNFLKEPKAYPKFRIRGKLLKQTFKPSLFGKLIINIPIRWGAFRNTRDLFATIFGEVYTHMYVSIKVEK